MFRASSAHLQEDTVVYKQHMVPSLSIRVLVACRYAAIAVFGRDLVPRLRDTRITYRPVMGKTRITYRPRIREANVTYRTRIMETIEVYRARIKET